MRINLALSEIYIELINSENIGAFTVLANWFDWTANQSLITFIQIHDLTFPNHICYFSRSYTSSNLEIGFIVQIIKDLAVFNFGQRRDF